jgi:hypothetical protein
LYGFPVKKGLFSRVIFVLKLNNFPGTMYLVNGDVINGEWREEMIIKASYKKGKFDSIPKYVNKKQAISKKGNIS